MKENSDVNSESRILDSNEKFLKLGDFKPVKNMNSYVCQSTKQQNLSCFSDDPLFTEKRLINPILDSSQRYQKLTNLQYKKSYPKPPIYRSYSALYSQNDVALKSDISSTERPSLLAPKPYLLRKPRALSNRSQSSSKVSDNSVSGYVPPELIIFRISGLNLTPSSNIQDQLKDKNIKFLETWIEISQDLSKLYN